MNKFIFAFATLFLAASAPASSSAATLSDVQTLLAPYIPQGHSVREMTGMTTYGGGATCGSSISVKPDEVEFFSTWGDTGAGVTLSAGEEISLARRGNQVIIGTLRDGLPTSVTLTFKGSNIESMLIEETYKSLFFKRKFTLLCDQQEAFIPKPLAH